MSQLVHGWHAETSVDRLRLEEDRAVATEWTSQTKLLNREHLSAAERERMEQSAFRWGAAPETYDIACSDGYLLRTPCQMGFVNVYPDRSNWHLAGGLIAPQSIQGAMIQWLRQIAIEQRRMVAIYSVDVNVANDFRRAGYAVNKFGEEPVIDLGSVDWKGSAFEWVRRQSNACTRSGLEVVEIVSVEEQHSLVDELDSIHSDDLCERVYSKPLRLLEGEFSSQTLNRRRLFVARDRATKRIEGFLAASPMLNGQRWAFETYRKRRSAPRGTVPFLFRSVIDQLQHEGVSSVSLCLVPGRGVKRDRTAQTDRRIRWMLKMWYGHLNFLFNTAGQDFFKSRFRPRYEERYLCVYPRHSLSSMLSFLRTSGGISPNWRNLFRSLVRSPKGSNGAKD